MGCAGSKKEEPVEEKGKEQTTEQTEAGTASLEETYDIGKDIGSGAFSVVREATHKKTGVKLAVKTIDKQYLKKDDEILLSREIDIMKKVKHPNVLSLVELFETKKHLHLVMELVTGGELFYKIVDKGFYTEKDAAGIVKQVCDGAAYLHSMGIAHRDLKPENLLCAGDDDNPVVKIADFGLSKMFVGGQELQTSCGTPDYAAPEVLACETTYDESVDMWSIGVITYILLCGFPPFWAKSQNVLFEKILNVEYDFPDPEWTNVSSEAKDFVQKLLVKDPKQRMGAADALKHPWLASNAALDSKLGPGSNLKSYTDTRKADSNHSGYGGSV